ncbi:MAG: C25 family cysteine peptidase [Deltaproteobacteria bacterium]|nr:C25 family cysteine peptidase [Deltaproteobacteria bacterium]
MPKIDKLIVTNVAALRTKYGTDGLAEIRTALAGLIVADAERGLVTRVIDLSSRAQMRALRGRAVVDADHRRENKDAIDAAYRAVTPDYLLLLGSIDVIPHQSLANPLFDPSDEESDTDRTVPSDLPYACEAPYSRSIRDFRGPTRVVGRLPDLTGARDPEYLLGLLRTAARYRTRSRDAYDSYFGLSVYWWRASTGLTLRTLFGSSDGLKTSPPQGPDWTRTDLAPRIHFINCHGRAADPTFVGQSHEDSDEYPDAHRADRIHERVSDGAVVAAECCYGADLYDPARADDQPGLCYAYLGGGAYGYLGSTTIAYGPSSGNGWADLLCRYFLEEVLRGASLGRALLEARHRYTLGMSVMQGEDLKTLAQFTLLGDPSIHAVGRMPQGLEKTPLFHKALADAGALPPGRGLRRDRLLRTGVLLEETVGSVRRARKRPPQSVRRVLSAAARDAGIRSDRLRFTSYAVHDPAAERLRRATRRRGATPTAVHTAIASHHAKRDGVKRIVLISATVERGRIVRLRRLHSR